MVPSTTRLDDPGEARHTREVAEGAPDMTESERLARRWWAIVQERTFENLYDLVHDDIVVVSKVQPGHVVEGRENVVRYMEEVAENFHEARMTEFHPVDANRIVVEGRLRWMDDERVIRDDPVVWAMEFRDGLLMRFVPARTVVEAETVLGARIA